MEYYARISKSAFTVRLQNMGVIILIRDPTLLDALPFGGSSTRPGLHSPYLTIHKTASSGTFPPINGTSFIS